jgi:hypothetical protein
MEQTMNSSERPGPPDMELDLFRDVQRAALPPFLFHYCLFSYTACLIPFNRGQHGVQQCLKNTLY